jgi:hypothetical protein
MNQVRSTALGECGGEGVEAKSMRRVLCKVKLILQMILARGRLKVWGNQRQIGILRRLHGAHKELASAYEEDVVVPGEEMCGQGVCGGRTRAGSGF